MSNMKCCISRSMYSPHRTPFKDVQNALKLQKHILTLNLTLIWGLVILVMICTICQEHSTCFCPIPFHTIGTDRRMDSFLFNTDFRSSWIFSNVDFFSANFTGFLHCTLCCYTAAHWCTWNILTSSQKWHFWRDMLGGWGLGRVSAVTDNSTEQERHSNDFETERSDPSTTSLPEEIGR